MHESKEGSVNLRITLNLWPLLVCLRIFLLPPISEIVCSPVTAGALDVHEVGVRVLDEPLQLVLPLLLMVQRVQQVLGQRHGDFSETFQGT